MRVLCRRGSSIGCARLKIVSATGPPTAAAQQTSLTNTLASAVYWLTFLLFLPAILYGLQLEGLLAPVEQLLAEALLSLPSSSQQA
jgi:hypothetical protein